MTDEFGPDQLVAIEYHTSDEMTFPAQSQRTGLYSFGGTPTAFFDGYDSQVGGYSGNYNDYAAALISHLAIDSPVIFSDYALFPTDSNYSGAMAMATITLDAAIAAENVKAWAVLTETPVQGWQYDFDWYDYVCRAIDQEPVTISQPGESQSFNFSFDLNSEWDVDELSVVFVVQDHNNQHVLQAATADMGGAVFITEYAIVETSGDDDQRLEAGETGELTLTLENTTYPPGFTDVSIEMTSDDPAISVTQGSVDLGDIGLNESADNNNQPLVFEIAGDTEPHQGVLTLHISSTELPITTTLEFIIGRPLLLVDDDNGDNLEHYFTEVFDEMEIYHEVWNSADARPENYLTDYSTVVWYTGDAGNALSPDEVDALSALLDAGSNLILNGQDIAELLPAGSTFLADYFGVEFMSSFEDVNLFIHGVPGDPYFDDYELVLIGGDGAANQPSQDILQLTPDSQASPIFEYPNEQGIAGVRYTDAETGYKAIFTGFGLEAIHRASTTNSREEVLEAMFSFFMGPTETEDGHNDAVQRTGLRQNYPNPFNPTTTIAYSLAEPGAVSLRIYDTAGRLVKTLVDDDQAVNHYQVRWDGTDAQGTSVASGVYIYQLQTGDSLESRRMILMK